MKNMMKKNLFQDILEVDADFLATVVDFGSQNGGGGASSSSEGAGLEPGSQWGPALRPYVGEIRVVHDGVAELVKHFWTCFPPTTPELEAKVCIFSAYFALEMEFAILKDNIHFKLVFESSESCGSL